MTQPKISVIIPVYNQKLTILDAIDSVIQQQWDNLELIIIDDGSTDNVENALSKLSLPHLFIQQQNSGAASARNRGIEVASGELIAFLDADDTWPEGRLHTMVRYMNEDETLDVVIGQAQTDQGVKGWFPMLGACLFRKQVFQTLGPLDEMLRYSEDQDWFLRAKEAGTKLVSVPLVSLYVTTNPKSTTYNKHWKELDIHKVLKMSLDRRRKMHPNCIVELQTLSSYQRNL